MRPATKQRNPIFRVLSMFALAVFGVLLTVGTLAAMGVIELPFLKKPPAEPSHAGMVGIPVSAEAIPAYTMVVREHLIDLKTLKPSIQWRPASSVRPGTILDPTKIVGRVLKKDKGPSFAFNEDDFFPEKTRPGLVAGIPPGKRALALDAEKLRGIHSLKAGDRFDLLATVPLDDDKAKPGGRPMPGAAPTGPRHAMVRVLVQNGMVVTPAALWKAPEPEDKKGHHGNTKPPPPEIVIAAEPKEIVALSEALALKHEIVAIARSGRPEDPGDADQTPELLPPQPPPPPRKLEVINGSKRQTLEFPENGGVPRVEPEAPAPKMPATPGVVQAPAESR